DPDPHLRGAGSGTVSDELDVLVVGRSLPALYAALTLAEVGIRVGLVPCESEMPGEPVLDPDGELAEPMTELAEPLGNAQVPRDAGVLPVFTPPAARWMRDASGAHLPLPTPQVWGIPATPLSEAGIRALGTGPALRAHLDRLMPVLRARG